MKTVCIVTSAFNEEDCIPELFKRLKSVFDKEVSYSFSIVIIDNSSSDNTWNVIQNSAMNLGLKVDALKMSRNFSLDSAFTCGIDNSNSDLIILMTSDLQDPPESISNLLRKFEQGNDQVLVRILSRKNVPIIRRFFSIIFYRIASRFTGGLIPISVSDFRLMTRKAYLAVSSMRESHRFIRGLSAWVGYKTDYVEIERPPRFAGTSKWTKVPLTYVIESASRSIFAYSGLPLALISITGFFLSVISIITLIIFTVIWFTIGVPFAGFGTIVGINSVFFSITMFSIGIIAQYLNLIYEEVKKRPLYLIDERASYNWFDR